MRALEAYAAALVLAGQGVPRGDHRAGRPDRVETYQAVGLSAAFSEELGWGSVAKGQAF